MGSVAISAIVQKGDRKTATLSNESLLAL